eukprot:1343227-Rhodomonas_salina.2
MMGNGEGCFDHKDHQAAVLGCGEGEHVSWCECVRRQHLARGNIVAISIIAQPLEPRALGTRGPPAVDSLLVPILHAVRARAGRVEAPALRITGERVV